MAEVEEVDILVIDDDPWIVELVVMAAEEGAWTVQSAPDGSSGLRLLATLKARLILLDVRLPRQDGWATLADIRRDIPNHPPIVMMTADTIAQDEASRYGAAAILHKPFGIHAFLELLAGFLGPDASRS